MNGRSYAIVAALALLFGFAGAALWSLSGLGDRQTRGYLLEHPELLAEMADRYQAKQAEERLATVADEVTVPFPGAVLGNPEGAVTLVEFTDYGCTYCRMSKPDVDRLIADNPDLRVVIREWPIFQGSEAAARMALAAAKQGKFAAFHSAMFELGPPDPASIEKAARAAGLDLAAAREFAASDEASFEIAKTMSLAEKLGFTGTPSWVVGGKVIEGAIGYEGLNAAIDDARESALAAAKQGKFAAFHSAMFELGPPDPASIEKAARAAGLDLAAAREFAASDEASFEIAKTMSLAEKLGFTGTPSWVVGGKVIEGAIGYEGLDAAIDDARES